MTERAGPLAVVTSVGVLALAGCGGGGGGSGSSHTYVLTPSATNGLAAGIYVTIVSPVPIPMKLLTSGGSKLVGEAKGPQKCSYTKTVQGSRGPGAFLSGKAVTIKINGTNPFVAVACSALKKTPFEASKLGSASRRGIRRGRRRFLAAPLEQNARGIRLGVTLRD